MPSELTPRSEPSEAIEVLELEDFMLDLATGGVSGIYMNGNCGCGEPNQGCNTVAGCGAG